jgi:hypothetical protein
MKSTNVEEIELVKSLDGNLMMDVKINPNFRNQLLWAIFFMKGRQTYSRGLVSSLFRDGRLMFFSPSK